MPTTAMPRTYSQETGILIPKVTFELTRPKTVRESQNKVKKGDIAYKQHMNVFILEAGKHYKFFVIKHRLIKIIVDRQPVKDPRWNLKKKQKISLSITRNFARKVVVFSGKLPI